jgi:peptidoglycan hydrolase-like amidase
MIMKKAGLLLIVLVPLIFAGIYLFNQTKAEIENRTIDFANLASTGNARAAEYLDASFENGQALLQALATPALSIQGGLWEPQFHSLTRATVSFALQVGDEEPRRVDAEMVRSEEGWKILSFPELLVTPVALVVSVAEQEVMFLDGQGEKLALQSELSLGTGDVGVLVGIDGRVVYFNALTEVTVNKLLTITEDMLEGEEEGIIPLPADTIYFRPQENGFRLATKNELIVAMRNLSFFSHEEQLQVVILPKDFVPDKIRVALNTTGFGGLGHRDVRLSGSGTFTLEDKVDGVSLRFSAGQTLRIDVSGENISVSLPSGETRQFVNRIHIIPEGSDRIQVETLRRGNPEFTPSYRGTLEVALRNDQLNLINEVSLESYLYSVVPSEMPVSFGLTPLKVQAVAARSYAVASILRSGFRSFAAHVDDSVSSQVYNNVPEYEISSRAVNETAGLVVSHNGEIADTRFFSTSSGVTANFEETWHDPQSGAFPATAIPYLVTRSQLGSGTVPDVSSEDGARTFFTTTNWDGFDKGSPWFRWNVEMTRTELEAVLTQYLPERQRAQPDYVLTQTGDTFTTGEISANPIGELKDLRVIRRGGGGNIMELEIEGTNGTYRLIKEYTIRFTLRPVSTGGGQNIVLERHDGSNLNNYALLPSAYMVMDLNRDGQGRLTSVHFRGGGNGHGVGLSQWGTRGLAERNRTFADILTHYYPGTTIEAMY